ncbi:MAG TPA: T9SS type A sorting domain-containing protein [Flavobacterium sp.]|jgi:hypothetical protein
MKIFLLPLLLVSLLSSSQTISFTDANLKAKLLSAQSSNFIAYGPTGWTKIDTNNNSQIEVSEAMLITTLNVSYSQGSGIAKISNLSGLENFIILTNFTAQNNLITSIDFSGVLSNLAYLNVSGNPLASLNCSNHPGMDEIFASNCAMTMINVSGCPNLEHLSLIDNELSTIDLSGLMHLKHINVSSNNLTAIDLSDLAELQFLSVSANQLTTIDLSDNPALTHFECRNNFVSSIDFSNNLGIGFIDCLFGQLASMDVSMLTALTMLRIGSPVLQQINIKNGVSETLEMSSCPALIYICADESDFEYVMNIAASANVNAPVTSYCNYVPGGNYNTISGQFVFDADSDGCDTTDPLPQYLKIKIANGPDTGYTFTNASGTYTFYSGQGSFLITPELENNEIFSLSPASATVTFDSAGGNNVVENFCISGIGIHPDLEVVIIPIVAPRPGLDAKYKLLLHNKGNITMSGNVAMDYPEDVLDFIIASPVPDNTAPGYVSFDYVDLMPFETREVLLTFSVNSPMETPAVNIDDVLTFNAAIYPVNSDENPQDNIFKLLNSVIGSFDPNDITCLEGPVVSTDMIGEYLHYMIRFENTGTAPAVTIVVKDVIDTAMFDMTSLQVMDTSHESYIRQTGNKVEFIFEDINLAPEADGYVLFKIRSKNTLSQGSSVAQLADIYFDYNFPVVTNTATTTFQALAVTENHFQDKILIYPNPVSQQVNIKADSNIISVSIADLQGRQFGIHDFSGNQGSINTGSLSHGVYLMTIRTDRGTFTKKILKN